MSPAKIIMSKSMVSCSVCSVPKSHPTVLARIKPVSIRPILNGLPRTDDGPVNLFFSILLFFIFEHFLIKITPYHMF